MTDRDIIEHTQRLFEPSISPGQAFDALFKMRQERVMWADVCKAITVQGNALRTLRRPAENEDEEFECPGCGVSRTSRAYCIVPGCPEHRPNPETERIQREGEPKFKNPKLTFGKYQGKTLLEIAVINPGYLSWMAQSHNSEFWKEQARMAQIAAETMAPPNRDTSDTGFFS